MSDTAPRRAGGRWRWALAAMVTIAIAVSLVVWLRSGTNNQGPTVATSYPAEVLAYGEAIYAANCATCHGPRGQGDAAAGVPALDGSMHAWHHPDGQIAGFIRNGVGRMPAVGPGWSQSDITAVLAYVKQWWSEEQRAYQEEASRMNP